MNMIAMKALRMKQAIVGKRGL